MNQHKFLFLDERGQVLSTKDHLLRDDLDALDAARKLYGDHMIEVWHGARQIARVKIGDEALSACDRQAL